MAWHASGRGRAGLVSGWAASPTAGINLNHLIRAARDPPVLRAQTKPGRGGVVSAAGQCQQIASERFQAVPLEIRDG